MCNKKHKLYLNSNLLKHGSNIFFSTNLKKLVTRISFHRNESHYVKMCIKNVWKKFYTNALVIRVTKRIMLRLGLLFFFNDISKFMWCNLFTENSVIEVMLLHWFWHTRNFWIKALWMITDSDVEEMTLSKHKWHKFRFNLGIVWYADSFTEQCISIQK